VCNTPALEDTAQLGLSTSPTHAQLHSSRTRAQEAVPTGSQAAPEPAAQVSSRSARTFTSHDRTRSAPQHALTATALRGTPSSPAAAAPACAAIGQVWAFGDALAGAILPCPFMAHEPHGVCGLRSRVAELPHKVVIRAHILRARGAPLAHSLLDASAVCSATSPTSRSSRS